MREQACQGDNTTYTLATHAFERSGVSAVKGRSMGTERKDRDDCVAIDRPGLGAPAG